MYEQTKTLVPSLQEMRQMSDAELLRLRTSIQYDVSHIESQLRDPENTDEEWRTRALRAQHIRQNGLGTVRNILAERSAERNEDRGPERSAEVLPLHIWMRKLQSIADAAERLVQHPNDDDDSLWDDLEDSLKAYREFVAPLGMVEKVIS